MCDFVAVLQAVRKPSAPYHLRYSIESKILAKKKKKKILSSRRLQRTKTKIFHITSMKKSPSRLLFSLTILTICENCFNSTKHL